VGGASVLRILLPAQPPRAGLDKLADGEERLEWLLSSGSSLIFGVQRRRAVARRWRRCPGGGVLEANRPPALGSRTRSTTNGNSADAGDPAFLFEHDSPSASASMGWRPRNGSVAKATFEVLDRLIEQLREEHAPQLRRT